jgi:Zn-dependent protease with chaperone function
VILTSVALLALGVLLAEPVSRWLAGARWPERDPTGALLLWQAVGLAGGLAPLGAGLTAGLAPLGRSLRSASAALVASVESGAWPGRLGPWSVLALAATAALAARLLGVLGLAAARTLRARRRHRDLLDVLGTPWPAVAGARVLAHPLPVAYCLPGRRSRLVVSDGTLAVLSPDELGAVLAHERAHLRERHDLVVLPFVAWGATARRVPGMSLAQRAVAALVEMRADDVARVSVGGPALAGALRRVSDAAGLFERATLTSFTAAPGGRLRRLDAAASRPGPVGRAAPRIAALALVVVPTALLLLP